MAILVIHPNDRSTEFLKVLYENKEVSLLTEKDGNARIKKCLKDDRFDVVMLLGHGYPRGLFAPNKNHGVIEQFGREIISSKHVDLLRKKKIIGIFCHANMFAETYGLHGLFSGMVISEVDEAYDNCISISSRMELIMHRQDYAENLANLLNTKELEEIPSEFSKLADVTNSLEMFNYNSMYYFP